MFIRQISPRLFNSTKVNVESQIFLCIKKIRSKILRQRFLQLQSIEQFNMWENDKVTTFDFLVEGFLKEDFFVYKYDDDRWS